MEKSLNNYYLILGVSEKSSPDDIKKAYRKLSLENHPDRHDNNIEKTEKFKKITEAYKVLSDKSEREKYDFTENNNNLMNTDIDIQNILNNLMSSFNSNSIDFGKQNINEFPFSGISIGQNPFNFSNIHKGFSNHEYKSKPAIISKDININFLESYNGCKIPITFSRWIIEADIKYDETETIYIDIPKGIDNNEIITIENKGNIINSTNKGDIKIKVFINKHNLFERTGIDLIFKKVITLKESLCGFSFDLTYLDGREFKINNEPGNIIPNNFKKIIYKMGMKRENDIGNLIIDFDIIYPKKLTIEQIKELEKILS